MFVNKHDVKKRYISYVFQKQYDLLENHCEKKKQCLILFSNDLKIVNAFFN